MSRLLIAALFAGVLCAQTTVTWTLTTRDLAWPKNTSWDVPQYDPISGKILFRGNPTSSTAIYSSMQYVYDVAARTFTAGSNPQGQAIPHNQCPANVDTLPTARHGYGQFAVDQGGSRAWFFGGLNQSCPVGINVNASGTTVTIPSGLSIFYTGAVGSWAGLTVTVDGISRTVASVTDTKNLELTEDLGTLTGVTFTYPDYGGSGLLDTYKLTLGADPSANTWTRIVPAGGTYPSPKNVASAIYSPDDEVVFVFGSDGGAQTANNWVFCPTESTLSAAQTAAGCTAANGWAKVELEAGRVNTSAGPLGACSANCVEWVSGVQFSTDGSWNGKHLVIGTTAGGFARYTVSAVNSATSLTLTGSPGTRTGGTAKYSPQPSGTHSPTIVYDSHRNRAILYGGRNSGTASFSETWFYHIPERRWELRCLTGCSPPPLHPVTVGDSRPAMVYSPNNHKVLFHRIAVAGPTYTPADYEYDPDADTWTLLQEGDGPTHTSDVQMAFDPVSSKLIVFTKDASGMLVWEGAVVAMAANGGSPASRSNVSGSAQFGGGVTIK